jgi:hypothetical protein
MYHAATFQNRGIDDKIFVLYSALIRSQVGPSILLILLILLCIAQSAMSDIRNLLLLPSLLTIRLFGTKGSEFLE